MHDGAVVATTAAVAFIAAATPYFCSNSGHTAAVGTNATATVAVAAVAAAAIAEATVAAQLQLPQLL